MDRRSTHGTWTREFLELIEARPVELAETIAASIGWERAPLKANVRRLKELGLTESLPTGYRLSPVAWPCSAIFVNRQGIGHTVQGAPRGRLRDHAN